MELAAFVRAYVEQHRLDAASITNDAVNLEDGCSLLAIECRCGAEDCEGWEMVPPCLRLDHLRDNDLR